MSKSRDYWKKRILEEQKRQIQSDIEAKKEMVDLYEYHLREIEKELHAFQSRYADKQGIPLSELIKRADDFDVRAFQAKAKQYVKNRDFSAEANRELSLYNYKMRYSRMELLQAELNLRLIALAEDEQRITGRYLSEEARQAVEVQAGLLGKSVPSDYDVIAAAIIYTPFHGVTWSSNISKRHAALSQVISRTMQDYLIKGVNPIEAIPILRREFGYSAKSAKRLLVTEGARVASQMQKYSFEKYGYKEYEYIAEPKACDICKPLNGKIFKVKEMMPGENAAPMHPHCRCSVAAHYSEENSSESVDKTEEEEYNVIRDSGSISSQRGDIEKQKYDFAERYYEQLKNSQRSDIVYKMVESTGLSPKVVETALEHIFDNKYPLWDNEKMEITNRKFYPNYDMAQSLQRLYLGSPVEKDIIMIQHEDLEHEYMNRLGMTYEDAHKLANQEYNYEEFGDDV